MNIAVFGAGAIGKAIASFIYESAKNSIYFAAKGKYYERLKNGINVNNKHYDIEVSDNKKADFLFV